MTVIGVGDMKMADGAQFPSMIIKAAIEELQEIAGSEGMRKLNRSECAILPLVLKGRWYDMIDRGDKREEYRDYKPYWKRRMANWVNHQRMDWDCMDNNKWLVIGFSRGYKKPDMFFLLHRHDVTEHAEHLEWGEPRTPHFVLVLGERVTIVDDESGVAK